MRLFSSIILLLVLCSSTINGQRLKVSDNGRFLVTENGSPFFWLADTAWELFHRCSREEIDLYLTTRKLQGFNVVQAVALAELNGLEAPNVFGDSPLKNNNPVTPNDSYFDIIDYALDKAASMDMYIALLPTWGDKLYKDSWGTGPEIFNIENAKPFGTYLAKRFGERKNLIWVIGGDRNPRENSDDVEIWNTMAEAIVKTVGGYDNALMTFHPQPNEKGGSSRWFHDEKWLDFNMHQTGHCPNQPTYTLIENDYNLKNTKPVIDGEPLYEDHPNCFNARELGYSMASDIRRIMYWNVFAGAFGQSYGCHAVWQMYSLDKDPVNGPLRPWKKALNLPMANQVKHLKNLILSRSFLTSMPDNSMIVDEQIDDKNHVRALRDSKGTYGMVYFPTGQQRTLDLSNLKGDFLNSWWYDPRTGVSFVNKTIKKDSKVLVTPPSSGQENDWVLVLDAKGEYQLPPGKSNQIPIVK